MAQLTNERFKSVYFTSLSPTSTTVYKRVLDFKTGEFVKPKYRVNGLELDIEPPTFKQHKGELSEKAARNLRRSINTLLLGVDENILFDGTGKEKVSFITLTLASSQIKEYYTGYVVHWADDKEIKRQCFNQLMTEIKQQYGNTEYCWVAEKQINGNVHYHVLLDKKIDKDWLRRRWNGLQNKFGFVDRYAEKMSKLTQKQYFEMRSKECKKVTEKKLVQWKKAYEYGQRTNWTNPNSTDIQTLKKVQNVAAYISKYMSKGHGHEDNKRRKYIAEISAKYNLSEMAIKMIYTIEGRIWQCSQVVSKARKCVDYFEDDYERELSDFVKSEKEPKIFDDEHYTTILHTFKQLKEKCHEIHSKLIQHIKTFFNRTNIDLLTTRCNSNLVLIPCT